MAKLLFLSGSTRKDSVNTKVAKLAFQYAQEMGADAKYIDLKDYDMPLYNGDLEEEKGLPENAKRLKKEFIDCKGFFISAPEYNSSLTPLLKNTLDWISRPEPNVPDLIAFKGKYAALGAASPGALGGLRGLVTLRMMLGNIGVLVLPNQFTLPNAYEAFDENDVPKEEKSQKTLKSVVKSLVDMCK